MKKTFFIFLLLPMLIGNVAMAQSYKSAIGVKYYPGAVTFKHFLSEKTSVEALGFFWNRGSRITALLEVNGRIEGLDGLMWYAGPGAHINFYNSTYGGSTSLGLDGVVGLDYGFSSIPLNLSLDWQPSFQLGTYYGNSFIGNWGGFSIRYILR